MRNIAPPSSAIPCRSHCRHRRDHAGPLLLPALGVDQQGRAEHVLVFLGEGLIVLREIHHQGTHERRTLKGDGSSLGIDVGQ